MSDTSTPATETVEYDEGYHDCPCCGETLCGGPLDEERCESCAEAGCEPNDRKASDNYGVYDDCQVPCCPECDTRMSFMNDEKWHRNCGYTNDDCPDKIVKENTDD